MKNIQWKPFIISILLSLGAGAVSAFLNRDGMRQYSELYHPPLAPPAWVFPVVWTILYLLMGISSYLITISDSDKKKSTLRLYYLQLLVNVTWPFLFFHLNLYILAFAWLVLLWYLVFRMIIEFYEIDRLAAWLQLPYIIWLSFAGYLNLAIAIYYW